MKARDEERARVCDDEAPGQAPWAGAGPSRRNYDAFRACQPSPKEWPSSSFIRKAFGNDWSAALAAIGHEPTIDITSRRLTAQRPYSRDEVLAVLRLWISEVDEKEGPESPLMQSHYEEWTKAMRSTDDPRFSRLPSKPTIYKVVGDWRDVLVALDCTHRHWQSSAPSSTEPDADDEDAAEPAAAFDLESAPPAPPRKGWHIGIGTDAAKIHADALVEWLRWLADQLPENERARLRATDFDRYMSSVRRVSLAQGKPLHPPSHSSFEQSSEIDSWLHAKYLAGMVAGGVPVKRSTKSYTERELIEAVLAARQALGPDMTRAQYTRWRDTHLSVYDGATWLRVPSETLLRTRFADTGRWGVAIESALRRADELGLAHSDDYADRPGYVGQKEAA